MILYFIKQIVKRNRVYIKSQVKPLVLNVSVYSGFYIISYLISAPQQGRSFMSREFSEGQRAPSSSLSPATKLCITGNGGHPLTFLMELIDLSHRKYFSQTCSNVPGLFLSEMEQSVFATNMFWICMPENSGSYKKNKTDPFIVITFTQDYTAFIAVEMRQEIQE